MEIIRYSRFNYGICALSYSKLLHKAARETPGMSWDGSRRAWVGWPDAVRECARRLKKLGVWLDGRLPSRKCTEVALPSGSLDGLRGYQKEGVRFMAARARGGVLLADEGGLGKSAQAARLGGAISTCFIIVCPNFVRTVWLREFEKWLPEGTVVVELSGTKSGALPVVPAKRNIYLVHYDIVYAWADALIETGADTIIFDEIHMLQGSKSRRSQACRRIAERVKHRIGLTGTPMKNRPADLWNPIDTLCPGRFGQDWDFYRAHAGAHQETVETKKGPITVWKKDGASRLKELNRRLRFFMLRRTKSDVRMELPPRTRQMVELEVKKNFRALPSHSIRNNNKWMREALAIAAGGKIPEAAEMIANHVASGSKVIVFSYRKIVAELVVTILRKKKLDVQIVTGDFSLKKRTMRVDEQHDVLCCTMDSIGAGVDLSYADVAVFVELDYDPSKIVQCEWRVFRFGQKRNTLFQYVIAKGTADEVIRDRLLLKLDHFEKAIGMSDDKLNEDLKRTKLSTAKQLRSLAERLLEQTKER